jgi:hypothetical protein
VWNEYRLWLVAGEVGHPAGVGPVHERDRHHHDAPRHRLVPQLDGGAAPGMAPHGAAREAPAIRRGLADEGQGQGRAGR